MIRLHAVVPHILLLPIITARTQIIDSPSDFLLFDEL